jgi:hypothetical protein
MDYLELDDEQRDRAIEIYKRVVDGEVQSPTDVVDSWETPERVIDDDEHDGTFPSHENFIAPENIVGTFSSTIHRVETGRLQTILKWMVEGEFETQHWCPPVVQKREDRYYVTSDGHHRCMAAKAVGLDELYVEYTVVPPELLE